MGWAVFPHCCLTWKQTGRGKEEVEVRKKMVTSFKMSQTQSATLSAADPAVGHCEPMPKLEIPGLSQTSLGQSLIESLLLSPEPWCTQGFVCALQEFVSPVLYKYWWLYGEVNGDLLQKSLCHTQVCCTQDPAPVAGHCWPIPPQETLKHSKAGLTQSLRGLLVCTMFCLSPLSVSGGYEIWF